MSSVKPEHAFSSYSKMRSQTLQKELQTSVSSALGHPVTSYDNVVVVFIRFQVDDIGVVDPEIELKATFHNYFEITRMATLVIPVDVDPDDCVSDALVQLRKDGFTTENNLIILIYSGHGRVTCTDFEEVRAPSYELCLNGAMSDGTPLTNTLHWNAATASLNYKKCDVVHILDCCYAAEACSHAELLGAASRLEEASAKLSICFTKALSQELRRLSSAPLTVAMLHCHLMANRRTHDLQSTPFYWRPPNTTSACLPTKKVDLKGKDKFVRFKPNSPRVLITAHVVEDMNRSNVEQLKTWLTTLLPASILGMEIKLEGKWESNSTVLLFSLPICVWTQIGPGNPAFRYVGEVTSSNQLLVSNAPALAVRSAPKPGVENTKPGQSSSQK